MRQHRSEQHRPASGVLPPRLVRAIEQLQSELEEPAIRDDERWGEQRRNVMRRLAAEAPRPRRGLWARRRWAVLCTATAALLLALAWWLPVATSRPTAIAVVDEIDHALAGRLPAALAPGALLTHEFETLQATTELSGQEETQ